MVTGPGEVVVVDEPTPHDGPRDIIVKVRACGVCGSDSFYIARGGMALREGTTPLGHETAGEVIEVGDQVRDIAPGDHVVIKATGDSRGTWASARAFCRGYQRVTRLSEAEVVQLPELFRLRGAMGTLWALGRGTPVDPARILEYLGYLRNAAAWLDQHGPRLADLIAHHLAV
jgi:threonine dehydrogenase-like Zn-dependent dehydrogenase